MIVDRELDAGYPKNPVPLRCFAYATRGLKMLSVKGLGESAANRDANAGCVSPNRKRRSSFAARNDWVTRQRTANA